MSKLMRQYANDHTWNLRPRKISGTKHYYGALSHEYIPYGGKDVLKNMLAGGIMALVVVAVMWVSFQVGSWHNVLKKERAEYAYYAKGD